MKKIQAFVSVIIPIIFLTSCVTPILPPYVDLVLTDAEMKFYNLSKEELELYNLIMKYRNEKNLPSIPISKSLTYVAQVHAKDVFENHIFGTECCIHSWSNKGNWSPCCYPDRAVRYPTLKESWRVHSKPRELTSYKGDGYEISLTYYCQLCAKTKKIIECRTITPEECLDMWKGSPEHNDLVINRREWRTYPWKAIGIGIYKGIAHVWFGERRDKDTFVEE